MKNENHSKETEAIRNIFQLLHLIVLSVKNIVLSPYKTIDRYCTCQLKWVDWYSLIVYEIAILTINTNIIKRSNTIKLYG